MTILQSLTIVFITLLMASFGVHMVNSSNNKDSSQNEYMMLPDGSAEYGSLPTNTDVNYMGLQRVVAYDTDNKPVIGLTSYNNEHQDVKISSEAMEEMNNILKNGPQHKKTIDIVEKSPLLETEINSDVYEDKHNYQRKINNLAGMSHKYSVERDGYS